MPFWRKKGSEGLRKMDAIVTGLLIGGVVASVFGARRRRQRQSSVPSGKPSLLSRILEFFRK